MARDAETDYYAILEVAPNARAHVVEAAWRQLTKDYHPDLHPEDASAEARMKRLNEAHDVLSDPARRAAYDVERARRAKSAGPSAAQATQQPRGPAGSTKRTPAPEREEDSSGYRTSRTTRARTSRSTRARTSWTTRARTSWTTRARTSWTTRALRSRVLPWLLYERLGQWLTVASIVVVATLLAENLPAWPLGSFTTSVVAFAAAGGVISALSGSWRGTPLGDVTDLILDAVPGLRGLPYLVRQAMGLCLALTLVIVVLALLNGRLI